MSKLNESNESQRMKPKSVKDLKSLFDKNIPKEEVVNKAAFDNVIKRKKTATASIFEANIQKQKQLEE